MTARLNLLCVEDDPADSRNLESIIDCLGWTATFASNGLDGYALAQTRRFDVIVTDQNMSDLTGLGLFKCVRTGNGPNAHTPFLLNSRSFTPDVIQAASELKVESLVEKPLLRTHLKEQLLHLTRQTRAANELAEPKGQGQVSCRLLGGVGLLRNLKRFA